MESKKYLPTTKENQFIKLSFYYSKGGMNYFTGTNERRGYYLSATPVERKQGDRYVSESFTGFSGIKKLILEVNRQSDKAFAQAKEMVKDHEGHIVKYVCDKQGITLADIESPENVEA